MTRFTRSLAACCCIALVVCLAPGAAAYRFVCNSVDSTGVPQGDTCGACTIDVAARWPDASAQLTVFGGGTPGALTTTEWESFVEEGLQRWNAVVGSRFIYSAGPAAAGAVANWGVDDGNNHLFWVDGAPDQWQSLTFTNPATTIALTAVQYFCQAGEDPREIYDADIAFNNTGQQWQCADPECWSIAHAVTHELGHALGLGHGCAQCTTSMMVSLANQAYQPTELLDDDREGCRALYPQLPDPPEGGPEAQPEPSPEAADGGSDASDAGVPEDCHCGGTHRRTPDPFALAAFAWLVAYALRRRRSRRRASLPGSPIAR